MELIPLLQKEMEQESVITGKMLKLVPDEKFDWKPHEKSMAMKQLTTHIAELPSWVSIGLTTDGIDFAADPYEPQPINNTAELVAFFEKSLEKGKGALGAAKEEDLLPSWTMRSGDQVYSVMTKYEMIRHSFSQTTHHRAQLGVYLRLLDIPIPGSYGPSADDQDF